MDREALCQAKTFLSGNPGPPWRDRFRWMYGASHPGLGQGVVESKITEIYFSRGIRSLCFT